MIIENQLDFRMTELKHRRYRAIPKAFWSIHIVVIVSMTKVSGQQVVSFRLSIGNMFMVTRTIQQGMGSLRLNWEEASYDCF